MYCSIVNSDSIVGQLSNASPYFSLSLSTYIKLYIFNIQLQCVLPINLYNEKIYIFLWFWLVFVAIASGVSFLVWLARSFNSNDRRHFIRNHLSNYDRQDYLEGGESASKVFTEDYLGADGALLLRLIAHNTNNITTTDIIRALYAKWIKAVSMAPGSSLLPGQPPVNNSSEIGDDISLMKAGVDA